MLNFISSNMQTKSNLKTNDKQKHRIQRQEMIPKLFQECNAVKSQWAIKKNSNTHVRKLHLKDFKITPTWFNPANYLQKITKNSLMIAPTRMPSSMSVGETLSTLPNNKLQFGKVEIICQTVTGMIVWVKHIQDGILSAQVKTPKNPHKILF